MPSFARLRRDLRRARISQLDVAIEAHVSQSCVSHVLWGRAKSMNVLSAVERLLNRRRDQEDERTLVKRAVLKSRGQRKTD
jgi:predicted transcriptional regulator